MSRAAVLRSALSAFLCAGVQMASRELSREGVDFNVSMVPSAPGDLPAHAGRASAWCGAPTPASRHQPRNDPRRQHPSNAPVFGPGLILPAIQKARECGPPAKSMNNMKQIALAMFNYESTYGHFPPAYTSDKKPGSRF